MAKKSAKAKAKKVLESRRVPPDTMTADQLVGASEESGQTFHEVVSTVGRLLQAGSGLGPAPVVRKALERGDIRG